MPHVSPVSARSGSTLVPMARELRLSLDDESAARLARFADRAQAPQDELAAMLLAQALDDKEREPGPEQVTAMLDGIPGAWEHIELAREQIRRGETIDLDEL
jgi:hypothetical protein